MRDSKRNGDAESPPPMLLIPAPPAAAQPSEAISTDSNSFWQIFIRIFTLFVPMGLSYTLSFSLLAVSVMAGYLNTAENDKTSNLGAASLSTNMLNMFSLIAIALIYAISIFTSRKRGRLQQLVTADAKSHEYKHAEEITAIKAEISRIPRNGVLIGSIPLPLVMATLYNSERFLVMLGQNAKNAAIAQTYLRWAALMMLFLLFRMCFEQILFGFAKQQAAMKIGLFNFAIGLFLAIVFGFGYLGSPSYGFAGFAYGFLIESFLTCFGFGFYLSRSRNFRDYHFFSHFKFTREDWQQIKSLLRIGLPLLFTYSAEIINELMSSLFSGWLGREEIAARNFGSLFVFLVMIIMTSSSYATCQETNRAVGAGNYQRANSVARYGLLSTLLSMFLPCVMVAVAPELFANLVANLDDADPQILSIAKKIMPWLAASMLFNGAGFNQLQVLRAVDDHWIPSIIFVCAQALGVTFAYILGFKAKLGMYGIVLGDGFGKAIGALALLPRWYIKLQPAALVKLESKDAEVTQIDFDSTDRQIIFNWRRLKLEPEQESLLSVSKSRYSLLNCCRKKMRAEHSEDYEDEMVTATPGHSLAAISMDNRRN